MWTGIGAVGTVLIGILVFKEPASFWRLLFITTRESLNKCVSLHSKPHFEMKHECKITVLETKCFADYQDK